MTPPADPQSATLTARLRALSFRADQLSGMPSLSNDVIGLLRDMRRAMLDAEALLAAGEATPQPEHDRKP